MGIHGRRIRPGLPGKPSAEVAVSFSVYEITVPLMVQGLTVLVDYLDHAEGLEAEQGLAAGKVLEARLAPDMLSFGEQLSVSCNKVEAHMARLMQHDRPVPHTPA